MSIPSSSSLAPTSPVIVQRQPYVRSPWHSPVPYLFGGLAAMLGLIAFALLILACSYWKLSRNSERDLESGDDNSDSKHENNTNPPVFEKKFLVIMAGQANPTFLATPITNKASTLGSCSCNDSKVYSNETSSVLDDAKQGSYDLVQVRSMDNHATSDQI